MLLSFVYAAHAGALTLDEGLNIKEIAALLKLTEETVYSVARAGEIPDIKIRGRWHIERTERDHWIGAQRWGGGRDGE